MQTRESGMPTEEAWQGFFDVQVMLRFGKGDKSN